MLKAVSVQVRVVARLVCRPVEFQRAGGRGLGRPRRGSAHRHERMCEIYIVARGTAPRM
jgi:hypothetical protein